MKNLILAVSCVLLLVLPKESLERKSFKCGDHSDIAYDKFDKWIARYNLSRTMSGFVTAVIYASSQVFPGAVRGQIELESRNQQVHAYYQILDIKTPGLRQNFRKTNYVMIWHFHHGHGAIFHNLNPKTKQLTTTDLRKRTDVYFVVVQPDNWYAFEFPEDGPEKFSMLGLTSIRATNETSYLKFANRDDLLREFPLHHDVINKIMS